MNAADALKESEAAVATCHSNILSRVYELVEGKAKQAYTTVGIGDELMFYPDHVQQMVLDTLTKQGYTVIGKATIGWRSGGK